MNHCYIHRFRPPAGDNYQFLMVAGEECLVVDPFNENTVFQELEALTLTPRGVLITHTHWDHINGLQGFLRRFPVPVYVHRNGAQDVEGEIVPLDAGAKIPLGKSVATTMYSPGHHPAHMTVTWEGYLIAGDVLFLAGCGNPNFGGDVEQLFTTVWQQMRQLDPELKIAWGHDYSGKNLAFAEEIEPDNPDVTALAEQTRSTTAEDDIPWRSLAEELRVNPFLRCDQAEVIAAAKTLNPDCDGSPREVFFALRQRRDNF